MVYIIKNRKIDNNYIQLYAGTVTLIKNIFFILHSSMYSTADTQFLHTTPMPPFVSITYLNDGKENI